MYRSRGIYGFLDVGPIWFLSAGIQKQHWQKKGNIKLNLADAFCTNKVRAITALTIYTKFFQREDLQVATISFTYRLVQSQVTPPNRRTDNAEEEKHRTN